MIHLRVRNESRRTLMFRRDELKLLADRISDEEGIKEPLELSVLFCDDAFISELNRTYRGKSGPTDVLSFSQERPSFSGARVLGDIVISLETVERFCRNDLAAIRSEVLLLFCHGFLHLLGYDHTTKSGRKAMQDRQARYLRLQEVKAWHSSFKKARPR